jgi:hypothetical protein
VSGSAGRAQFTGELLSEAHRRHIFEGEPDEDLIEGLEPDQLVEVMNRQLPRARLGPAMTRVLWVLRVLLLILAAMAIYSFASAVRGGS